MAYLIVWVELYRLNSVLELFRTCLDIKYIPLITI